ncbi:hypothetical protein CBR_g30175 [Chara braunii]|uniref:pectinesterase n=1 Tax=Chara braunii TaxID=69332 RepID=A0A388LC83_CHABU|nr:hypothetical protein CBR_g30175 [Chara braunii]|eukprot:GBG79910.1 hypothetical protein CBR_g30175 [Chara braunii]
MAMEIPAARQQQVFLLACLALTAMAAAVNAQTVTVGAGKQYSTIGGALSAAGPGTTIAIDAGTYREKLTVSKSGIKLMGTGGVATIVWGDTAASSGSTQESATVTVASSASGFTAVSIGFKNDAGPNKRGSTNQQGVALYVLADSTFYQCTMDGHQDTLFAHEGRQYYKGCWISGTVDFAFGAGTAFFEDCTMYAKKRVDSKYATYTAQQRTSASSRSGFVFLRGSLKCDAGVKAFLGRGWGQYARTIFIETSMDDCIRPEGWTTMKSFKTTDDTFFAEYNCTGPGSDRSQRVSWAKELTPEQAQTFSNRGAFLGGRRRRSRF